MPGLLAAHGWELGPRIGTSDTTVVHIGRCGDDVVAMKLPAVASDRATANRLRREAAVLGRFHHPHLLPCLGLLERDTDGRASGRRVGAAQVEGAQVDEAQVALLLPLARAGSVADLLHRCGPLPIDRALALVDQLDEALDQVHRAGFAHGNVTTADLLFADRRSIWLTGLSRANPVGRRPAGDPGGVDGRGRDRSAHTDDQAAAAAIGIELLTGTRPDDAAHAEQLLTTLPERVAGVLRQRLAAALRTSAPPSSGTHTTSPPPRTHAPPDRPDRPEPTEPLDDGTPHAPPTSSGTRSPLRRVVAGCLGGAGLALLVGVAAPAFVPTGGDDGHVPEGTVRDGVAARSAEPCGTDVPRLAGGVGRTARLPGELCASTVVWHAADAMLEVPAPSTEAAGRYRLGIPGDVAVFGDWNADGHDEPALYRPTSGMVYRFDRWARGDEPTRPVAVEATGVEQGEVSVHRPGGAAPDRVVVRRGVGDPDPAIRSHVR